MFQTPSQRTSVLTLNQDKRRRFDSYPGSCTAGQALMALAAKGGRSGYCTLGLALTGSDEAPLPQPEGERELVWREGFGWVERPIDVEVDAQPVAA
jgi:hypothetical protein